MFAVVGGLHFPMRRVPHARRGAVLFTLGKHCVIRYPNFHPQTYSIVWTADADDDEANYCRTHMTLGVIDGILHGIYIAQ